jgi:predicted DNA binding CopG/RHH family protein
MKKIPRLKSEAEEREFWAKADSTDYIDWSKAKKVVFPNLKPSLRTISLRLPESMLEELKRLANKHDVPYQSLIKLFLAERIEKELKSAS